MSESSPNLSAAPGRAVNLVAIVPVALFGVLALGFLIALYSGDPSHLPSALIGQPVPKFALAAVDGLTKGGAPVPGFGTSDLGNGKVSIVNVWASWCSPCRQEQPLLGTLSARLGVPLFGIDQKDAPGDAARFLQALGNPFTRIGADKNGRVSIDWGVYGVPETYIVDGSGKIAYKFIGEVTEDAIEKEFRPAIERARQTGGGN